MIIAVEIYYYTVPTQNHIIVPFLNRYFIGSDNDGLIECRNVEQRIATLA